MSQARHRDIMCSVSKVRRGSVLFWRPDSQREKQKFQRGLKRLHAALGIQAEAEGGVTVGQRKGIHEVPVCQDRAHSIRRPCFDSKARLGKQKALPMLDGGRLHFQWMRQDKGQAWCGQTVQTTSGPHCSARLSETQNAQRRWDKESFCKGFSPVSLCITPILQISPQLHFAGLPSLISLTTVPHDTI